VLGDNRGCIVCEKRLKLSWTVDECKPLEPGGVTESGAAGAQPAGDARQGLTLVPISAQLELTLPLTARLKLTLSPIQPNQPAYVSRRCSSSALT
jgi:hypothetical protein